MKGRVLLAMAGMLAITAYAPGALAFEPDECTRNGYAYADGVAGPRGTPEWLAAFHSYLDENCSTPDEGGNCYYDGGILVCQ